MSILFDKASRFVYRNARSLDFARWQYHFEGGNQDNVLNALAVYQNEDGGFGYALEADSWNPNSAPIQTWTATEILREINVTDRAHPIIKGILRYLDSKKDFDGQFWYNTIISNNDHPHAPWWHTQSESTCHNNYNPTACLAGFIIRFADKDSSLYNMACAIAKEAFQQFMSEPGQNDMHTTLCYIRLMQYCEEAMNTTVIDLISLKDKLREQVKNSITTDTTSWKTLYICKPSQFFSSKDSIFYDDNKEISEYECEHIKDTQLEDGSWNIPWGWEDYPEQWAISKNWWKANGVINNVLYLHKFDEL